MRSIPLVDHSIDPRHPFRPSCIGPFRQQVTVNGNKRSCICYIPEHVRSSAAGIFVLPKNGVTAEEMLSGSNWADLAETDKSAERMVIYFLEPSEKGWNPDEPSEDIAYVQEVFLLASGRTMCCIHESKNYLVGYGDGGAIAQMAAMYNPAVWAGVVSVNAPELNKKLVDKIGGEPCVDLGGYEDSAGIYGYLKRDFTVPAWIISQRPAAETAAGTTAAYWRNCAGTSDTPVWLKPDLPAYVRTNPAPWGSDQEKEAFRVWVSQMPDMTEDYGNNLNLRLWTEFLYHVRRWRADPGGDLRITYDPSTDPRMEYHCEEIGGWMREYYLYVPASVHAAPAKAVPLVFAVHGYSCSGEIYIGNSEWFKVAEERGFLVCFPSAAHGYLRIQGSHNSAVSENDTELPAWNILDQTAVGPDEPEFFKEMIRRISARYAVDGARIFATGHSMGSLMVQYLGMALPEVFAAIAPCSGVLFAGADVVFSSKQAVKSRAPIQIPVWMFGGEREEWLLDGIPTAENKTGQTIYIWWGLNGMPGETPKDFEAHRTDHGRWLDYSFNVNSIPMIRYTCVEGMPHATMTEMSYRIWDEFFGKISRNADGSILFASE